MNVELYYLYSLQHKDAKHSQMASLEMDWARKFFKPFLFLHFHLENSPYQSISCAPESNKKKPELYSLLDDDTRLYSDLQYKERNLAVLNSIQSGLSFSLLTLLISSTYLTPSDVHLNLTKRIKRAKRHHHIDGTSLQIPNFSRTSC